MKHLSVPFIQRVAGETSLQKIAAELNNIERHFIDVVPWPSYSYVPKVSFAIAHSNKAIYVKYFVDENYVQAHYHEINDPLYNDSCVEFFIGFNNLPYYYNLEFNCLGTALIGYGKDRQRDLLDKDVIKEVRTHASLPPHFSEGQLQWELTIEIPVSIFQPDKIDNLQGKKAWVNFFKCGEELPQRHYCVWNQIDSPQPNFHLPEYFGSLQFL